MDVHVIRLLVDVARRGSFAAVARDRNADPSAVSRAIAGLEAELGTRLLQRTTRAMRLTEAGARYVERVGPAVDALEQAREDLRSAEPAGAARVTASATFGQAVLVPVLPAFRAAFPRVRLELLLSDTNLDLVTEGIDLAFRLGPSVRADVVGAKLFDTRYRVVASPAYLARAGRIAAPSELAARRCVLFSLPGFRSAWRFRPRGTGAFQTGAVETVAVSGDILSNNAATLRGAALGGLGPALLPDWLVDRDIAAGTLADMLPDHDATATSFETAAWLLYPSREHLAAPVRAAIGFFRRLRRGGVFV